MIKTFSQSFFDSALLIEFLDLINFNWFFISLILSNQKYELLINADINRIIRKIIYWYQFVLFITLLVKTNFISTEIDLDRDVPDYIEGDFDVDVDENGPFITASFDDEGDDSDLAYMDDIVANFDFDDYCDQNPDFNAALNGHWEYV